MAIESKMSRPVFGRTEDKTGAKRPFFIPILIVIVLVVIGAAWMFFFSGSLPLSSDYQAVFIDSGQVYFGQLEEEGGEFYRLTDVFYLQTGYSLETETDVSLVKLGGEMHGPEDEMFILKEHILFIEDLTDESKVVQAIESYKNQ